jgi:hypothetical protein
MQMKAYDASLHLQASSSVPVSSSHSEASAALETLAKTAAVAEEAATECQSQLAHGSCAPSSATSLEPHASSLPSSVVGGGDSNSRSSSSSNAEMWVVHENDHRCSSIMLSPVQRAAATIEPRCTSGNSSDNLSNELLQAPSYAPFGMQVAPTLLVFDFATPEC